MVEAKQRSIGVVDTQLEVVDTQLKVVGRSLEVGEPKYRFVEVVGK